MTGYMQHTCLGVVLVTSLEVVLRVNSHIAGWYIDILVVRDIYTSRIVHLIISTRSDREARYSTLTMIKYSIHIRREHALIFIIYLYCRISPPQECLRQIGAIANTTLYLQISTARTKRKTSHTLLMEHTLHLIHPHSNRTVFILYDGRVYGHIGTGTMVLGPVELYATRYPGTSQTNKCRFYYMVIINKMALLNLVVCHLHTSAKFWQYHHLDILILNPDSMIVYIFLLIAHRLDDGIWINNTTRSLIHSLL